MWDFYVHHESGPYIPNYREFMLCLNNDTLRVIGPLCTESTDCRWILITNANSHNSDVIMGAMAPQITSLTIVYSTVHSGADQRKHQRSVSLAFVREFTGDRLIPRTNGQ